jgi:hypothetical protein
MLTNMTEGTVVPGLTACQITGPHECRADTYYTVTTSCTPHRSGGPRDE